MRLVKAGKIPAVMLAAVFADRLAKIWAIQYLSVVAGAPVLLPGILRLRYAENTGAAFSMFSGGRWLLIALTGLLICGMIWYALAKKPRGCMGWGVGLIIAGGISNLYDRIAWGYVVDYLEFAFIRFPVFNLADVCVCVGTGLLILAMLLQERREKRNAA